MEISEKAKKRFARICRRIEMLRCLKGVSCKEAAKGSGVSEKFFQKIADGEYCVVPESVLFLLSAYFEVSFDYLIGKNRPAD